MAAIAAFCRKENQGGMRAEQIRGQRTWGHGREKHSRSGEKYCAHTIDFKSTVKMQKLETVSVSESVSVSVTVSDAY